MTALMLNYAAGCTGFKPLLDKRSLKRNDKYEFTHHIKHTGHWLHDIFVSASSKLFFCIKAILGCFRV